MTSIHIYDPSDGAALPELPPLPIGVLAVGTADLLQQAADLPQPRYITIYDHQSVSIQFAPEQASMRAITRWALRFGSVVTSQPHQGQDGPETWHRDRLRLLRHRRHGVRPHPGRTGQHLTRQCRAWGTAIPRPGQPQLIPLPAKAKESLGMSHATSGMPARPVSWTGGTAASARSSPACCAASPRCTGPRSRACPATRAAPRPGSPPTRATQPTAPG